MKIVSPVLKTTLDLCAPGGDIEPEKIEISINFASAYDKIRIAVADFLSAQQVNPDSNIVGEKFIALMRATFGDDITSKIIQYFNMAQTQDDAAAMIVSITPVFFDVVLPALQSYRENLIACKRSMSKYKT